MMDIGKRWPLGAVDNDMENLYVTKGWRLS